MTLEIVVGLGFVVVLVLCGLTFWIGHLAGKARAQSDLAVQTRALEATAQAQSALDQVQASAAPDDAALDRRLSEGTF